MKVDFNLGIVLHDAVPAGIVSPIRAMLNSSGLLSSNGEYPIGMYDSEVVDLDENLALTAMILNDKGYCTTSCCSGHFCDYRSPFIRFAGEICFDTLPEGFSLKHRVCDDETVTTLEMEHRPDGLTPVEAQLRLWSIAADLLRWAVDLPELVEEE